MLDDFLPATEQLLRSKTPSNGGLRSVRYEQGSYVLNLTVRQQQCLEGYLTRKTAKQIGRELSITHHAVEQHLKAARRKLGVTDTAEAARLYAQASTTVEPYCAPAELQSRPAPILDEVHPERTVASLRDVASEGHGRVYAFSSGQVLAAIGLCSVGLIIILALLVAIAQGVAQLTS